MKKPRYHSPCFSSPLFKETRMSTILRVSLTEHHFIRVRLIQVWFHSRTLLFYDYCISNYFRMSQRMLGTVMTWSFFIHENQGHLMDWYCTIDSEAGHCFIHCSSQFSWTRFWNGPSKISCLENRPPVMSIVLGVLFKFIAFGKLSNFHLPFSVSAPSWRPFIVPVVWHSLLFVRFRRHIQLISLGTLTFRGGGIFSGSRQPVMF